MVANFSALALVRRLAAMQAALFPVALLTVALCAGLIAWGAQQAPGGYDGTSGLNVAFGLLAIIWSLGFMTRCRSPGSQLAAAIEAVSLAVALSLISALATEALALGGGEYIDPVLVGIDRMIVPFAEWPDVVLALPHYPFVQALLSRCYMALNWQAFLFIGIALFFGRQRDLEALLTAYSVGLMGCILPFHWLPARGPYAQFGITPGDVPGAQVALPWDYPAKLEALRSGTIDTIGLDAVSGLVTVPSFHACSAVIFGWAFWRFRVLRWPMVAVNALMFVAAVPIGGHYFIDVVAGAAAGGLAITAARALERYRSSRESDGERKGASLAA